jgi:hypothetical protein
VQQFNNNRNFQFMCLIPCIFFLLFQKKNRCRNKYFFCIHKFLCFTVFFLYINFSARACGDGVEEKGTKKSQSIKIQTCYLSIEHKLFLTKVFYLMPDIILGCLRSHQSIYLLFTFYEEVNESVDF